MSIYSDKLAHIQVVINCPYSVAQLCTCEDKHAHTFGTPCIDDDSLTTSIAPPRVLIGGFKTLISKAIKGNSALM